MVRSPQLSELATLIERAGATPNLEGDGTLIVTGMGAAQIGDLAAMNGIPLHELSPRRASLESAFMEMTQGSVEYRSAADSPNGSKVTESEPAQAR